MLLATSSLVCTSIVRLHTSFLNLFKAGSQFNTCYAGGKWIRVRRKRLGFYSCISCIHVLRHIMNRALVSLQMVAKYHEHVQPMVRDLGVF